MGDVFFECVSGRGGAEEQDTLLKKVVDSLHRCWRDHKGLRRPGSKRIKPGGALVDFCIGDLLNHRGSRWFQHQRGLIMQLTTFGKFQRYLMRRWEFFGREVLGPRIFYRRRRRPGSRRTTSLGLRAVLVKVQSSVNDTFGLFDRSPLKMQLVMLLLKFRFPFKVAMKRSLRFWTRGNIDKLLVFRGLGQHQVHKFMICWSTSFFVLVARQTVKRSIVLEQAVKSIKFIGLGWLSRVLDVWNKLNARDRGARKRVCIMRKRWRADKVSRELSYCFGRHDIIIWRWLKIYILILLLWRNWWLIPEIKKLLFGREQTWTTIPGQRPGAWRTGAWPGSSMGARRGWSGAGWAAAAIRWWLPGARGCMTAPW